MQHDIKTADKGGFRKPDTVGNPDCRYRIIFQMFVDPCLEIQGGIVIKETETAGQQAVHLIKKKQRPFLPSQQMLGKLECLQPLGLVKGNTGVIIGADLIKITLRALSHDPGQLCLACTGRAIDKDIHAR